MTTAIAPVPTVVRRSPAVAPSLPRIVTAGLMKSYPVHRGLAEALRRPLQRSRTVVLRDVTLAVQPRELFGILGLNGAGKTTLLKILAGLVRPDGGAATIDGENVIGGTAALRGRLAIVTADERSLNWRLSARENLLLFAGLHGMPRATANARMAEALESVGLTDTGRKMVGAFSSGMRQRLLVARALLSRPTVLLLDEPTRSLDPLTAHAFRQMLREVLIEAHGATVLLATHNTEEAFMYCDRVAVLHRGTIAALGSASELASRFVRDRFHIRTIAAAHHVFADLVREGRIGDLASDAHAPDGVVTCDIPGGDDAAAGVLHTLVQAGVPVSRFERVPVALGRLIERIAIVHDAGQRTTSPTELPHA